MQIYNFILNFQTDYTTVNHLKVKLRSLLRAFKASRDTANRTGAGSQFFPYEDLMNEIFGRSAIMSASAVNQVGFGQTVPLMVNERDVHEPIASTSSAAEVCEPIIPTSSATEEGETIIPTSLAADIDDQIASTPSLALIAGERGTERTATTTSAASSSGGQLEQRTRPRQTAKDRYYERKLVLMEKYLEEKAKRHDAYLKEKLRARAERHRERMLEIQRFTGDT